MSDGTLGVYKYEYQRAGDAGEAEGDAGEVSFYRYAILDRTEQNRTTER